MRSTRYDEAVRACAVAFGHLHGAASTTDAPQQMWLDAMVSWSEAERLLRKAVTARDVHDLG